MLTLAVHAAPLGGLLPYLPWAYKHAAEVNAAIGYFREGVAFAQSKNLTLGDLATWTTYAPEFAAIECKIISTLANVLVDFPGAPPRSFAVGPAAEADLADFESKVVALAGSPLEWMQYLPLVLKAIQSLVEFFSQFRFDQEPEWQPVHRLRVVWSELPQAA